MRIAFDAKRAFQNRTGLGHYSRTLIATLAKGYPAHNYYLAAPKQTPLFDISGYSNMHVLEPRGLDALFPSFWRTNWVKADLQKHSIDIFHGLSNEIPVGIQHTGIKSIVTIHDLIFERYPKQYKPVDTAIYRKKFRYACNNANKIIAISGQTKQDIIDYYKIPEARITVCYQSCNPQYTQSISAEEKIRIKQKYNLPDTFFLYVGSIIERKNLQSICEALHQLKGKLDIPLIVIGHGNTEYEKQVKQYVAAHNLQQQVRFLHDEETLKIDPGFQSSSDFPAIYHQALAMIYPSVYEGFGLPVLEALCTGTPVITSNISCMPETGGNAALYVDPYNSEDIANAMRTVASDAALRQSMIQRGYAHAQQFNPEVCASHVMDVYLSLQ